MGAYVALKPLYTFQHWCALLLCKLTAPSLIIHTHTIRDAGKLDGPSPLLFCRTKHPGFPQKKLIFPLSDYITIFPFSSVHFKWIWPRQDDSMLLPSNSRWANIFIKKNLSYFQHLVCFMRSIVNKILIYEICKSLPSELNAYVIVQSQL